MITIFGPDSFEPPPRVGPILALCARRRTPVASTRDLPCLLKSRKEIIPQKIGFMGASEGTWVVGLATQRFKDAAFVIMESGGGVTCLQQQLYMYEMRLRGAGLSEVEIKEGLELTQLGFDVART